MGVSVVGLVVAGMVAAAVVTSVAGVAVLVAAVLVGALGTTWPLRRSVALRTSPRLVQIGMCGTAGVLAGLLLWIAVVAIVWFTVGWSGGPGW